MMGTPMPEVFKKQRDTDNVRNKEWKGKTTTV